MITMYSVYRIVARSGHTYVGVTSNLAQRMLGHRRWLKHGLLGDKAVPDDVEIVVEVLHTHDDVQCARVIESRAIAEDKLRNPFKNCNRNIGRFNLVQSDEISDD